ncbi:NAD(P)-dependent alcohol dehydrogenase [Fluviicola sp.]|uniref:NAD(P)-dependent alcohol dehydrogenase n=1 Tax=Fluviicola sp. TaxID=1917219 RepID=UPI00262F77BE|nr:NAD(P)-dependent alcohol dehydrogenase [Fluviicola sp.]
MEVKQVKAYGTENAEAPLKGLTIQRRTATPHDVEIDILYCGVCHSDLHTARNDWGGTIYPSVPGHEIVGRVISVGNHVTKFKTGDLVGVGCIVDSCRECSSCKQDLEQYCVSGMVGTYNGKDKHLGGHTFGGYSEKVVVDENYVLKVPENLNPAAVAPILCAGVTTWSPLRHWNVTAESKVAVVGLGGLGHMAIKLAKALGAEVTLFSRSPEKTQDALELGADRVIISTDDQQMQSVKAAFDLIIDTVPYVHNVNEYIPTLNINGTLVLVGYLGPLDPMLNTVPMILGRKAVAGSVIGGIAETQELLDFCGKHNIVSEIEMINIQDINHAYERMLKSDVKYRFVIDMASL